jgi:hypothetical protein
MSTRPTLAVRVVLLALVAASLAAPARAYLGPGQLAPNFTKTEELPGAVVGSPWSLYDHQRKVIVVFVMGYD